MQIVDFLDLQSCLVSSGIANLPIDLPLFKNDQLFHAGGSLPQLIYQATFIVIIQMEAKTSPSRCVCFLGSTEQ